MKKTIFTLLLCFVAFCLFGQEFYMYVNGQKRVFNVSETKMLIRSNTLDTDAVRSTMQRSNAGNLRSVYNLSDQLLIVDIQSLSRNNVLDLQKQWSSREDVIFASPVFVDDEGHKIGGLTNQVLIRLKSVDDYPLLRRSIANYEIKHIKQCEFDEQVYLLTLIVSSAKNAMQVANELHRTGLFEYSEPNLIQFLQFASVNDPHFQHQWGLHDNVTGIRAPQAWGITTGSSNIRIAVLDNGVDLNHPDLRPNLLQGFDATGNFPPGHPNAGSAIGNTGDWAHGTASAGIIAARGNNSIGIAGVAYNSRILPVRIATRPVGWDFTESNFIRLGIEWARENHADVISMSFGCLETDALNVAIRNAITLGRNNRGIVLVAASHNQGNTNVTFPATSQYVISVGSIDRNGRRSSFSNFGPNLDVVAPGRDIYTTGVLGAIGYGTVINNGQNGVYFTGYTGTSAAAPHVAGIAALILSVNPNLTQREVRNIIEATARVLPRYAHIGFIIEPPELIRRCEETGYGLVDAYAAVSLANLRISPAHVSAVCPGTTATFSVPNLPDGASVRWTHGPSMVFVGNSNNPTVTVRYDSRSPSLIGTFPDLPATASRIKAEIIIGNQVIHTLYRNLTISRPVLGAITGPSSVSIRNVYIFTSNVQGASGVNWSVSPTTGVSMASWSHNQVQIGFGTRGTYRLTASAQNACGTTSVNRNITVTSNQPLPPLGCPQCIHFPDPPPCPFCPEILPPALLGVELPDLSCCSSSPEMFLGVAFPNPVSDVLTIDLTRLETFEARTGASTGSATARTNEVFYIRLFNAHGMVVRQQRTQAATIQFDVSNLPEGTYYLHIEHDGEIEKHQIIVQRN